MTSQTARPVIRLPLGTRFVTTGEIAGLIAEAVHPSMNLPRGISIAHREPSVSWGLKASVQSCDNNLPDKAIRILIAKQHNELLRAAITSGEVKQLNPNNRIPTTIFLDDGIVSLDALMDYVSQFQIDICLDGESRHLDEIAPENEAPETTSWKMKVQAEAKRRWTKLRKAGANPTKHSLKDDLAKWCGAEGLKTKTGINPSAEYIYRHALRGWTPPND